jgi:inorganic triphosphatase YgiF
MSLRIRTSGNRMVQTLKRQAEPSAGFFVRAEYEIDGVGPEPDLEYVRQHCQGRFRKKLVGPLRQVFRVEVRRTEWPIRWEGSEVIVSFDEGIIRGGGKSETVHELEVELRHGDVKAAFDVARQIAKLLPLRLQVTSKAERGYRLLKEEAEDAEKAHPTSLARNSTTAAGVQAIAAQCVRHFAVNDSVFLATHSPEAVHQMRVAMRRLSSLISFFGRMFSKQERATLRAEIRRVFNRLGAARDLDIVQDALGKCEASKHLSVVRANIRRKRGAVYAQVVAMLGSRRFCLRMLDLLAFIEQGSWTRSDDSTRGVLGRQRLRTSATRILQRQWERLCEFDRVSHLRAKNRHRLRIQAKAFRYGCEFFGDLFSGIKRGHRRDNLLASVSALQDGLGELNDLATVRNLLGTLAGRRKARGLKMMRRDRASKRALLDTADAAQKRLCRRQPFWS